MILTSFKRYHEEMTARPGYSIAVYQPNWLPPLPKLEVFDIRNNEGKWKRPRDYVPEGHGKEPDLGIIRAYHDDLLEQYSLREPLLSNTLSVLEPDAALCCWCPYDHAAKRQIAEYGSFICHSMVVETVLRAYRIPVERDEDRRIMPSSVYLWSDFVSPLDTGGGPR